MLIPKSLTLVLSLFCFFAFLLFFPICTHAERVSETAEKWLTSDDITETYKPKLNVDIPGVNFTDAQIKADQEGLLENNKPVDSKIPWMAQYLYAIFKYSIQIAALLATLSLIVGGFLYMSSAGSQTRVSKAKEIIFGAVTGLVLLMSTYLFLNLINKDLTNFKAIRIDTVPQIEIEITGDEGGSNKPNLPNCDGINAPSFDTLSNMSRAAKGRKIVDISRMYLGKVSYIIGSQDGPNCTLGDGQFEVCFDCSGLVSYAYKCGLTMITPRATKDLFASNDNTFELEALKPTGLLPGDLIGWKGDPSAEERAHKKGHVGIYIGNSKIMHVHGPSVLKNPERYTGTALSEMAYEVWMSRYPWSRGLKILQ